MINYQGEIFIFINSCPHMGYPLYFGEFDGKILRCGFHYNRFDVTTGKDLGSVTREDLRTVEHEISEGKIYVKIQE